MTNCGEHCMAVTSWNMTVAGLVLVVIGPLGHCGPSSCYGLLRGDGIAALICYKLSNNDSKSVPDNQVTLTANQPSKQLVTFLSEQELPRQ